MRNILILLVMITVLFFGLSSISQSYASAKQAQAVIETARVAQIASAGNLIIIAALAILLLAAVDVIVALLLRTKSQPSKRWVSGPNAHWDEVSQPNPTAMLPALMSLMLYQMMQHQNQEQEQLWQMSQAADNEPVAYLDIPWEM